MHVFYRTLFLINTHSYAFPNRPTFAHIGCMENNEFYLFFFFFIFLFAENSDRCCSNEYCKLKKFGKLMRTPIFIILFFLFWLQPNFRAKKSLSQMEKEIIGIGADQKWIFNRLRLFIDYFLLRNKVDRKQLTEYVSELISKHAKVCGQDIRPMRVQRRLCAAELYAKFFANNTISHAPTEQLSRSQHKNNQISLLDDDDDGVAAERDDDDMKGEVMEFLMSPADISEPIVSNESSNRSNERERKSLTNQQSLLKPKEERISLPKDEKPRKSTSPQFEAINLSRLKLKEALCKAKDKKSEIKQLHVKAKSASPEQMRSLSNMPKPIAILSSSQSSSSSSSEDIYETAGNSCEPGDSNAVDKETFMRLFGLCTHSYSQYMSRRHTKRKRNCTSTERGEYHYGRLDLFEKQYANKRNKRQFLYSPPATRAKKQRRAGSDAEAHSVAISNAAASVVSSRGSKTNISSSSSSGSISSKVCVTCFKRSKCHSPNVLCPRR